MRKIITFGILIVIMLISLVCIITGTAVTFAWWSLGLSLILTVALAVIINSKWGPM